MRIENCRDTERPSAAGFQILTNEMIRGKKYILSRDNELFSGDSTNLMNEEEEMT